MALWFARHWRGECDEASWPDKDHGLVCGECKVLVGRFDSFYGNCDSEAPAYWAEDIQSEIDSAVAKGRNASVFIPPGNRLAFGTGPVTCDGNIHLSVRSTREGATLDGEKLSNMFDIKGGCSLSLYALRFVNGRSERYGGAVKVYNAGNIAMQDVSFTDCESGMYGGAVYVRKTRGDISLVGVTFRSCKARQGGAVLVLESGATSMDGATFIACTADLDHISDSHSDHLPPGKGNDQNGKARNAFSQNVQNTGRWARLRR
ncbi:hypothetical protein EMIHUDRAFT_243378 [Emiliania huxleyi CCMP1516]|uniref:Right handed beta helix domain-containing protein n=2 Tax=Emiliania huxleyi TaxID=2903 RepID=A0A0D3J692_EMIH1|nr:hypothetical protein EMIHUDRAFT_243378 [Emiliania huxleyi CCMP1516]EOD19027.1 hypothetical protein EMIHUDRAFT_243378 [Emiliania huxleyi CCMP1516]|eukprot:XP_005771456.1 hypothetical protein EMIHUDRAFT_243378 [Emiliania huxleyi CCMP1516]